MADRERVTSIGAADLIGDLCAPEGSRAWCLGMRFEIQQLLDNHQRDHESLRRCVAYFIEQRGWEQLLDPRGKPFATYTDFCKAPRKHGLGMAPEEIEQIIAEGRARDAQQLAADPGVKPLADGPGRPTKGNVSDRNNKRPAGETAAYLVRRLKRDAPEVARALAEGKYPSARAAGIAAGIVKVPTALDLGRRSWFKMTPEQRTEFLAWLYTPEANPTE